MKYIRSNKVLSIVAIGLSTITAVIGLNLFLLPFGFTMGGYSGFAMLINRISGIPVALSIFALNVPTFLLAKRHFGREFFIKSLFSMAVFSLSQQLIPSFALVKDELLSAVYGGIFMGTGLAGCLYFGGSTGGTDLLSVIIHKKYEHISVSTVLFAVDGVVVVLTAAIVGLKAALYSLICVAIVMKLIDISTEGIKRAKLFLIISSIPDDIKQKIFEKLQRGVTELKGAGGYTNNELRLLLCSVERSAEAAQLKKLVWEADEDAFVICVDAREVIGRGFASR